MGYGRRNPGASGGLEYSPFRRRQVLPPQKRRIGDRLAPNGHLAWRSLLLDRRWIAVFRPETPASVVHRQAVPARRTRHPLGLSEALGAAQRAVSERLRGAPLPTHAQ